MSLFTEGDDYDCREYHSTAIELMKEAFNLVSVTNEVDGSMPNLEKVSQGMKFIAFLTADSITGTCNCSTKHEAFDSAMNSFAYYRAQTERLILLGLGRDARCRDDMQT